MATSNAKVSDLLRRYASALVLDGVDRFKVKAYQLAVDTIDALSQWIAELDFIHAGLNQARRAWLKPSDVLNTKSLANLKKLLAR